MIDIHCHMLPCIDDGSKSIDTSLAMLEDAVTSGVTDIILTPHYIKGSKYHCSNKYKEQLLKVLREGAERFEMPVNLYLGNEVYIDDSIKELIEKDEVATLAGSKYVLVELPVGSEDNSAKYSCYDLVTSGYVPVIAHPERYVYFQENLDKVNDYIAIGCIFQGDYQALLGKYGKAPKKALEKLIKGNKIKLLASDAHKDTDEYNLGEAYKKVTQLTHSSQMAIDLFEKNPQAILDNEDIA